MLFNSIEFAFFFVTVFFLYYALPHAWRPALLLIASCLFYMAFVPKFILILFLLIGIDYTLGLQLGRVTGRKRAALLGFSIAANLGVLFWFKYFNFFQENVAQLALLLHWNYAYAPLRVLLPLGLSFHVFQSLSYVIEVYKGRQKPERSLLTYALYVMFFPQLVAGPIERPQHLLHQFHERHEFDPVGIRRGLEIMLVGFFKKLVIADNLALLVNTVFKDTAQQNGVVLLIAAAAFTYQLYCDFSGYSDIAVGTAKVFGYDLVNNFNRPYRSRSIAEFWRRWHISLSNWLRDYLYYPLAFSGGRVTKARLAMSTIVTFVLIGLWHGANWTYVAMGALHGIYLTASVYTVEFRRRVTGLIGLTRMPRVHSYVQLVITLVLVGIGFIFFRSVSVAQALQVLDGIAHAPAQAAWFFAHMREIFTPAVLGIGFKTVAVVMLAALALEWIQHVQEKAGTPFVSESLGRLRWAYFYGLTAYILFFGFFGAQSFIYFQF